jgi:hypothetical protein
MTAKQKNLDRFWHRDEEIEKKYASAEFQIFGNLEEIALFNGTHPAVMKSRVGECDSTITKILESRRKRKTLSQWIEEDILHTRIGEYKNYKLL